MLRIFATQTELENQKNKPILNPKNALFWFALTEPIPYLNLKPNFRGCFKSQNRIYIEL